MKKAFTLLETVISISLFVIILFFLYRVLNNTKLTNSKFEKHIRKSETSNYLYKIITADITQATEISSFYGKNKNIILIFKTNNTFHNPFYTNGLYMVSPKGNLLRIESKKKFKKRKLGENFYENSYIDTIYKDVKKFLVLHKKDDDKYVFIIETKDKKRLMFPVFKMVKSNVGKKDEKKKNEKAKSG